MNNNNDNGTVTMSSFGLGNLRFTTLESALFLCLTAPLISFTLVSNLFVIHAISNHNPLSNNPSNIYLLSLAVTDLMVGLLIMPVGCYYNIVGEWSFGLMGCKMWGFTTSFLSTCSIYHLLAIAADRYWAIADPVSYFKQSSKTKSLRLVSSLWIISLIMTLPPFFSTGWGLRWPEVIGGDTPCTMPENSAINTLSLMAMMTPILVNSVIYIKLCLKHKQTLGKRRTLKTISLASASAAAVNVARAGDSADKLLQVDDCCLVPKEEAGEENRALVIKKAVKGSKRRLQLSGLNASIFAPRRQQIPLPKCQGCQITIHATQDESSSVSFVCKVCSMPNNLLLAAERSRVEIQVSKEKRSFFIVFVTVVTYTVCWLPGCMVMLFLSNFPSKSLSPWLVNLLYWLAFANSACNPVIYTAFNRDFQDAFMKIFFGKKDKKHNSTSSCQDDNVVVVATTH